MKFCAWLLTCEAVLMQISLIHQPRLVQGNGPLAVIEFWRERNSALSALSEQLKLAMVIKMLEVLSYKLDQTAMANFKMSKDE